MIIPPSPLLDSASDLTIVSFIFALLLFSFFSLCSIFHLRVKSKQSYHLKDFNSIWTVRILLVSFICFWALSQLLHLPFLRYYIFPFLPSLTLTQQTNLCKIHIVFSLGLFEPGFLVILLFLVNLSIKRRNPDDTLSRAFAIVFSSCLPIVFLQVFFVFLSQKQETRHGRLPEVLWRSFVVFKEGSGISAGDVTGGIVLCAYPLLSTIVFGAFGVAYVLCFILACWKVAALVINKGLRIRIYTLAFTVSLSLPTQILSLGISAMWRPGEKIFQGLALVAFISVLSCAVVGEGLLIIRPIADALAAGGDACSWKGEDDLRSVVVEKMVVAVAGGEG